MKKIILVGIMLMMFCGVTLAKGNYDFRNVNWGTSRQMVIKSESGNPFENKLVEVNSNKFYRVRYDSILEGFKCRIIYFFDLQNKLYEACYALEDSFEDQARYITETDNFIKMLSEKYGQPVNKKYGMVSNSISWKSNNTSITIHFYNQEPGGVFVNILDITYKDIKTHNDL
jgi:hypothetical protein